jgi:spore germination cell wall hydrolase CwlJ-like protein
MTFIIAGYILGSKVESKPINVPLSSLTADARKSVECLADNIFFESAYEPREGQIAVAFVTLNRVKSELFPDNICDVVKQKTRVESIGNQKVVCQFSWYCEPKPKYLSYFKTKLTNNQKEVYNQVMEVALYVYVNHEKLKDPSKGALFYHADYVRPNWKNVEKTTVIGRHIFYVKKGFMS